MKPNFSFIIQLAGVLQLVIAAANFPLASILGYRENLARVSPMIRQIFRVHALYIILFVAGFGLTCITFPRELCGASALGRFLCGFLAVIWGLRIPIQFFYYDATVKKEHPIGAFFFGAMFIYIALAFIATALFAK